MDNHNTKTNYGPGNILCLDGLYMPRHPHDVIETNQVVLASIDDYAKKSYDTVSSRYSKEEPRWEEMDRYWAGEQAALAFSKKSYKEFLPGKYFTYKILADIVKKNLEEKVGTDIKGARIAEMGCGSAIWSLLLAQLGAEVYLLDKSWCALDYAIFLSGDAHFGIEISESVQGNFFVDIPDKWHRYFDAVVSGGVIEHFNIKKQNKYFSVVSEMLKPKGITAFSVPNIISPFNIVSNHRKEKFYQTISELGKFQFTIPLPMGYSEEGGRRNIGGMLRENNFNPVREVDAVLFAPSAPVERGVIENNEVAKRFYNSLETICAGLINRNKDGVARVDALIEFWNIMGKSLSSDERRNIGRWLYAIGQKPK